MKCEDGDDLDLPRIIGLIVTGDPGAAPTLRELAGKLIALAERLEAAACTIEKNPYSVPSGMTDRVRMRVNRPDGTTTETDTGVH